MKTQWPKKKEPWSDVDEEDYNLALEEAHTAHVAVLESIIEWVEKNQYDAGFGQYNTSDYVIDAEDLLTHLQSYLPNNNKDGDDVRL